MSPESWLKDQLEFVANDFDKWPTWKQSEARRASEEASKPAKPVPSDKTPSSDSIHTAEEEV